MLLQGFRPVPEIQFFGFVYEVMDSISGQMARMRYRSGGRYHAPVTIRSPFGGGVHTPEMHADSLEGLMAQQPGLKVVIPSTPYDAKGLLISAIRDNDPVIFFEHMKFYRSFRQEVPEEEYTIPLGKAEVKREGNRFIDYYLWCNGSRISLKAAEELEKEGHSVEVIDLRTVQPLDIETIIASVEKTGRAIVVQEAQKQAGIAANVVAEINDRAIFSLEAPVLRVTAPDTVFPFSQAETVWFPNYKDIIETAKKVLTF